MEGAGSTLLCCWSHHLIIPTSSEFHKSLFAADSAMPDQIPSRDTDAAGGQTGVGVVLSPSKSPAAAFVIQRRIGGAERDG
eukprot:3911275-Rhodomonas_salina.1